MTGSTPHQRISSLNDLKAVMLENSFNDLDLTVTLAKESSISANHFQRRSSRSVLSPRTLECSSAGTTENSAGSSPTRLSKSASLASLKSLSLNRRITESDQAEGVFSFSDRKVLPISSQLSENLKKECQWAIEFLAKLQEPAQSRTSTTSTAILPPTALKFSKGLAFLRQNKAGIFTSWTWGTGFVVARLGPGIWSAPLFLNDKFLSCGLTCGYRTVETCYAIPTASGLDAFKAESVNTSFDMGLTTGVDPLGNSASVVTAQSADRTTDRYTLRPTEKPKVFCISDGIILDFSWRCGMHLIDEKKHKQIYGADLSVEDILSGKVQIPAEFKPFYETLAKLAAECDVLKPTVSQFDAEKERNKLKSQSSLLKSFSKRSLSRSKSSRRGSSSDTESVGGDTYLMNGSLNNSIGSQYSAAFSLPLGSRPSVAFELPSPFPRLFSDTELLDLDLDGPTTPKEGSSANVEDSKCRELHL